MPACVRLEKVEIVPGRMRAHVRIPEGMPTFTNPRIAGLVLDRYPILAEHSCINAHGPVFGDVIEKTSIAHLLEHMVIAEQAEASLGLKEDGVDATFVGVTKWVGKGHRSAMVEVSFLDDLVAVNALARSLEALDSIIASAGPSSQESPCVAAHQAPSELAADASC